LDFTFIVTAVSNGRFVTKATSRVAFSSQSAYVKNYLEEKRLLVEDALDKSIVLTDKNAGKIVSSMRYSLLAGGKRIRPILCIAACEMFGGTTEMALPTAVSLEMIHTMSLIHDDLPAMDNDALRRGKPTNHVVYGEDIAILAGDALLSIAFEHMAKNTKGVSAEKLLKVTQYLGMSVGPYGIVGGQAMDLEYENKTNVTLDELQWIHVHKTAVLLQVAVATGAVIGGATEEEVKAVEEYALKVGLAFQIADDILDCTASSEELGKTAGKDEEQNKTTYVKLLGLEKSKQEAQRIVDEAKQSIARFGDRAIVLQSLADYIVNRKN